ncbi:DUF3592 domain-containing protein [Micromonospora sp. NPDC000089]|uniref:DUF3592 domain-containing protein n=1 Tax=Micromonospora sp. NPDC000089 TaxID=3364213 RepID=UPI0036875D66
MVVIVGFAIATWQTWSNDNALRDRGREAPARVVQVNRGRAKVEFTTGDGRRVQARIGQGDAAPGPRPVVGDAVTIVYDPRRPTDDVRDVRAPENRQTAYVVLGATIAALIGVPLATWGLIRANRRERAAR